MTVSTELLQRRPTTQQPPIAAWWCWPLIGLLCLKFVALGLDPNPRFFMGDSGSYLWTAFSGWIPPDRSFVYGFLIRWTALAAHSLTALLVLQVFLGTVTAILVAKTCRQIFSLSAGYATFFGLLCAIDPLQWVWERYVMAETVSLSVYAALLVLSLFYLRERRLSQLAVIQVLGVCLISLRISYLLAIEATAILLPLIAFTPLFWARRSADPTRSRSTMVRQLCLHLATSVILFFLLHQGYQRLNGYLTGKKPAYLYSSGLSIMATWAPILQPADAPDSRLATLISEGNSFHLRDPRLRNSQLYSPDFLIGRWKKAEPDLTIADRAAKQTALHALLRNPLDVFGLGARTFLSYFDWRAIHRQAQYDLGQGGWPKGLTGALANRLRLAPPTPAATKSSSLLQRYFVAAQPYYYIVLFAPVLCVILFFFWRAPHLVLLFAHSTIFLGTNSLLAVTASVRYLQPLSLLTILIFAALAAYLLHRREFMQADPKL
ncbi:MAG: hypothetical protein ACR2G0_08825 [Chthoniobacterales bacterium]